jgi:hypothetical protein
MMVYEYYYYYEYMTILKQIRMILQLSVRTSIKYLIKLVILYFSVTLCVQLFIPNEVTGFFNRPNPPSHTMALGWTQPL